MGIEEALEIIDSIETILLLEERHTGETIVAVLALLLRLRNAPGPEEIVRQKVFRLENWVASLFRRHGHPVTEDGIKGNILAECQSLKCIISHAAEKLRC